MPRRIAPSSNTLVVALLLLGIARASAFVLPQPQTIRADHQLWSSRNDGGGGGGGGDDPLFFDDFGDLDGTSPSNANGGGGGGGFSVAGLRSRVGEVRGAEAAYDAKIARNWRRGNWGVRGFALDKRSSPSPSSDAAAGGDDGANDGGGGGAVVHVSAVAAATSASSFADVSLPQDRALPSDRTVAVGRTDGSVFVVKLGEQYLTNFVSVPKLVVEQDGESGMSVGVKNEWMDSNELKNRLREEQIQPESPIGADDGGQMAQEPAPFEIMYQFLASERGEPIDNLIFDDAIGENGVICTAAGDSGDICLWPLPSPDENAVGVEATLLSGVHSDRIVSLGTMVLQHENANEQNVLFSASRDGVFALWDLNRGHGELIFSHRCADVANDGTLSLTCADVSNPTSWDDGYRDSENDTDFIVLGMSNGYVTGYVVQELMSLAARSGPGVESEVPVPNLRFRAHGTDSGRGDAVTAIKCGGDGTIPTSARLRDGNERPASSNSRSVSSSILITGGEDGSVKQWYKIFFYEICQLPSIFFSKLKLFSCFSSIHQKGNPIAESPVIAT